MIQLANIIKEYGTENKIKALDNISLKINQGEFVALTGESGSGKSTLLSIMGLIEKPTSGEIIINKINASRLSQEELAKLRNKSIGFVFQSYCLDYRYKVWENVAFPMWIANAAAKDVKSRVEETLFEVGMEDYFNRKISSLSGGEQQRVAIARALVKDPEIILADEPTGNLDSSNGKMIMEVFKKISIQGKTIVMATHNATHLKEVDVIIKLYDGKII